MILNDNSTQQINTLVIQLQNRITNLNNELKSLNKEISNLDSKISDLEIKDSSQANDQAKDIAAMNAEIKANTKAISGKADKNHTHIKSDITDFDHNHDDRYYTESEIDTKLSGKADKIHTHTKSEITDFPTSLPANGGTATKASLLDEYVGAGGPRPTSGNIIPKDATEYGGMRKDVVTSSMTDGSHPGQDGHLLTMFWDNSGRYDSQVFVSNEKQPTTVKVRVKENEADYGPWVDLITSQNIGSQTVARASTAGTADKIEPNWTSAALTQVTSYTVKYVKVAYCGWWQEGTLQVFLRGNNLQDTLVINFGGGNAQTPMLCGYYSGNTNGVYSVIVQKGSTWNSNYSIYVKVREVSNCNVYVAILKGECTIDISESTTVPTNISEWSVNYGLFGNITSPEITSLEQRVAALESKMQKNAGNADNVVNLTAGAALK